MVKFEQTKHEKKDESGKHDRKEEGQKQVWYKTWWGVLIVIFFILPFWLIWEIWAKTKWNNVAKVVVTLLVIGFYVMVFANGVSDTTQTAKTSPTATSATSEAKQENKTAEPTKQPDVPRDFKSALNQAATYSKTMHLSKKGIYDQLVSEYGGKFSAEAAQYAIDNVEADWNVNALEQAKSYQNTMNLSPAAVRDQLTSQYGGQFTKEEADYAIEHLND